MAEIYYARVDEYWTRQEKYAFLEYKKHIFNLDMQAITPDAKYNWLTDGLQADFEAFIPLGSKEEKSSNQAAGGVIFKNYSNGVKTNRDAWAYHFSRDELAKNMRLAIEFYNDHVSRYARLKDKPEIDEFVSYDDGKLSWAESLKINMVRGRYSEFDINNIRNSLYRPFSRKYLYFDRMFNERVYQFPGIFATQQTERENIVICVSDKGSEKPFMTLISNNIIDLHIVGAGSSSQCFPLYFYDENGENRQENITDWALKNYKTHYDCPQITKHDIFYYVYSLLHHPGYREKYRENLRRELPRIPMVKDLTGFQNLSGLGRKLADLHLNYETAPEYPLEFVCQNKINWHVQKMRFNNEKTAIIYNETLTLRGIPPEALDYRLGNRSALDWVIDQYRVTTDKRSGITNDPNRQEDERYIARLVCQVTTVSVETVKLVKQIHAVDIFQPA